MKKFTLGLVSVAALATTVLVVRQQKTVIVAEPERPDAVPTGEPHPLQISLDRLRELGY